MDEIHLDGKSKDIVSENISKLQEIFPEAIVDEKIDFEMLKSLLGEDLDDSQEKYTFTWPGKTQSIKESQKQSTGTLRPCKEESKNWNTTQNLYVEGDNLEVLKLLQKGYYNKIKMIYIDPPYNTGRDFVYPDNYNDNLKNYLELSGQMKDDFKISTNTESEGRYHSNWLNMMYPRLKLARNLLTNDGVIFISIDDNEVENLKKICNEIFGEENFVCQFVWKSKLGKVGTTSTISTVHEYILCYGKRIDKLSFKMIKTEREGRVENLRQWGQADRREDRPSMFYPIEIDGKSILPIKDDGTDGRWRVGQDKAIQLLNDGLLEVKKKGDIYNIYRKFENSISFTPYDTLLLDDIGTTAKGAYALKDLDLARIFDYSKPIELIQFFSKLCTVDNDYILDFFSGSSTTAHAIFELNKIEKSNRKFIMVQIPELTDEKSEAYINGLKNICEIGKERIRRAGDKIIEESSNIDLDIGFKVFKLDSSNLEKWDPDYNNIKESLIVDNIKPDRSKEDLIYELMIKYGLDLTFPIESKENNIYSIGYGALIVCLEDSITNENTKEITNQIIEIVDKSSISRVVFKDSSFNNKDSIKTNVKEILSSHEIDKFITI